MVTAGPKRMAEAIKIAVEIVTSPISPGITMGKRSARATMITKRAKMPQPARVSGRSDIDQTARPQVVKTKIKM
jgi:hypothetical protein